MVIAERALIYSDQQMSSVIGYVARGKKIRVGEIPRNQAQLYPVVVSGKVAYIKVSDVSTQTASVDSKELIAERFNQTALDNNEIFYSLSYLMFNSILSLKDAPGELGHTDSLIWQGVSIRGGKRQSKRFDLQMIVDFLKSEKGNEGFTIFETGVGANLRIIQTHRLSLKFGAELLLAPFANYHLGSLFRVNGYGYTLGSGLTLDYRLGERWGVFALGGIYHTQIQGLDLPKQYQDISPAFTGSRFAAGASYQF